MPRQYADSSSHIAQAIQRRISASSSHVTIKEAKTFTDDWSFLNMDDISQLNLRVLKRHNPYITSLIDKSSYCVIYTFSTASASWTKAGYEGTLFIYSQQRRTIQTEEGEKEGGEFGFCVLNRLNLDNFWGEVNGGDIVLEDQFIITRSLTGGKSKVGRPFVNV